MIDAEPLILDELQRLSPLGGFEQADWYDVLQRVKRLDRTKERPSQRRRKTMVIALALFVIVVIAAPALGIGPRFLDFWTSRHAPSRVVRSFATLNRIPQHDWRPNVIAGETRLVTTYFLRDRTPYPLWVAPRRGGGFCDQFKFGGGCTASSNRIAPDGPGDQRAGLINLGTEGTASLHLLIGNVFDQRIATLAAEYRDGAQASIPLIWVGPPISAGFFFYEVPRGKWRSIVAVVAKDAAGDPIARNASRFVR
jgi:hypothetical protein